ncbi:hypothetical protein BH10PLA2_BH10PLA2_12200 [soil metagenome]
MLLRRVCFFLLSISLIRIMDQSPPLLSPQLTVSVYYNQQPVCRVHSTQPIEIGRQQGTETLYGSSAGTDRLRLVVAPQEELSISRAHALIQAGSTGKARVANLSKTLSIKEETGLVIEPGRESELTLPARLALGRRIVRIEAAPLESPNLPAASLMSLPTATQPPGADVSRLASAAASIFPVTDGPDREPLLRWIEYILDVLQTSAASETFLTRAAQALVEVAKLQGGRILEWSGNEWKTRASHGDCARPPSQTVLDQVRLERRTFWRLQAEAAGVESLQDVASVVAAPILNPKGEVISVLYGDRLTSSDSQRPITEFEARLVEVLASGVAAGLARVEQEKAAVSAIARFEQFFTPALASRLASDPGLLDGKECEVTVLVCDIRGFSRFSESLGAARTVAWIGDVMTRLSNCILDHQGVLVDYVGDEVMAMWGAPDDQPNQAARACQAALDMLAALPELNERWATTIGQAFSFGIGINSGPAHVGNVGSKVKFKYGPLGNTVNLASRVQGASKHLHCQLLLTSSVQKQIGNTFNCRRIGKIRVMNIEQPVELYELASADRPGWAELKAAYETALASFEQGDFQSTARAVGNLSSPNQGDGPALRLLARAANLLAEGAPKNFDPVWTLKDK